MLLLRIMAYLYPKLEHSSVYFTLRGTNQFWFQFSQPRGLARLLDGTRFESRK